MNGWLMGRLMKELIHNLRPQKWGTLEKVFFHTFFFVVLANLAILVLTFK